MEALPLRAIPRKGDFARHVDRMITVHENARDQVRR